MLILLFFVAMLFVIYGLKQLSALWLFAVVAVLAAHHLWHRHRTGKWPGER